MLLIKNIKAIDKNKRSDFLLKIDVPLFWPEVTNNGGYNVTRLISKSFICGYCSNRVSSDKGYPLYNNHYTFHDNVAKSGYFGGVYICPECLNPSYFYLDNQIPGPLVGNELDHLPGNLSEIYNEVRKNISNSCYTSAVLLSRKLLMNIAVHQGAKENLKFIQYVNYLDENNFIPPNSKVWVDSIRKKGNEATHEIKLMEQKDATQLLLFLEMILSFSYSFHGMMNEQIVEYD